jgi:UDP-glucose 4-epimerase
MTDKLVLVTGGAGFIGSRVCSLLLQQDYKVRVLDSLVRADEKVASRLRSTSGIEFVQGDIRHRDVIDRATAGVEGVVHLAASCINKSMAEPSESIDTDLLGAERVFEAAVKHKVKRVVFASSASVYGEPDRLPMREDDPLRPQTPYCIAKRAGEDLLRFHRVHHGLESNVLRYFNVYGPGQKTDAYYTSVIQVFLRRIVQGEPPVIDGDGAQSMDFVHVDDVARATAMAYTAKEAGLTLNVGTGIDTSIATLAGVLIRATGKDLKPQFRPRRTLVTRRAADISRIRERLGWEPQVDVERGLLDLAKSFLAEIKN